MGLCQLPNFNRVMYGVSGHNASRHMRSNPIELCQRNLCRHRYSVRGFRIEAGHTLSAFPSGNCRPSINLTIFRVVRVAFIENIAFKGPHVSTGSSSRRKLGIRLYGLPQPYIRTLQLSLGSTWRYLRSTLPDSQRLEVGCATNSVCRKSP